MNEQPSHAEEQFDRFLAQLERLLREAKAARALVTVHDLAKLEERLVAEIRAHFPAKADLAALDALLARSRGIAARLAALDASTSPPVLPPTPLTPH